MRTTLYIVLLFSFYIFSYYVSSEFILGDQKHYHFFYDNLFGLNIYDAFMFYKSSLDSSEPVYFLIVYIVNEYISKDIFFSVINTIFAFVLLKSLIHKKVSILIIVLLSLNFYFFVLLFSAERLKVALLLLLLSFFVKNYFFKTLLQFTSFLTHGQTIILIFSLISGQVTKRLPRILLFWVTSIELISLIVILVGAVAVFYFVGDHILHKLSFYSHENSININHIKPVLIAVLTIIYAQSKKLEAFLALLPLVLISFVVGAERIVIFTYFVFLYYALDYKRGLNAGVLITSLYFMLKGINFIHNIVVYGDGFYCTYNPC